MNKQAIKSSWKIFRFDEIVINVGDRVNPADTDLEYYVGLEHIDMNSLKIRRWGNPKDVESTKLMFKKGDIIFGKRRVYQRKLAVADFDGICSAHAMVLRPKTSVVLSEFLPFFMQSDKFMNLALEISVGSLSPTINWRTLAKQKFVLPPLDEQRRIVGVLANLELVITNYKSLNLKIQRLINSYMFRSLSVTDLGGEIPEMEFSDSNLNQNLIRIGDLSKCTVPGRTKPKEFVGDIPWIITSDMKQTVLDTKSSEFKVAKEDLRSVGGKIVPPGSVILTCVGELGLTALVKEDVSFNQQLQAFEPIDEILPEYLVFVLRAQRRQMISKATSTTVLYLNKSGCENLIIPVPSIEMQKNISIKLLELEKSKFNLDAREDSMRSLKLGMLNRLL